jgi:hypothetical protein
MIRSPDRIPRPPEYTGRHSVRPYSAEKYAISFPSPESGSLRRMQASKASHALRYSPL